MTLEYRLLVKEHGVIEKDRRGMILFGDLLRIYT